MPPIGKSGVVQVRWVRLLPVSSRGCRAMPAQLSLSLDDRPRRWLIASFLLLVI